MGEGGGEGGGGEGEGGDGEGGEGEGGDGEGGEGEGGEGGGGEGGGEEGGGGEGVSSYVTRPSLVYLTIPFFYQCWSKWSTSEGEGQRRGRRKMEVPNPGNSTLQVRQKTSY